MRTIKTYFKRAPFYNALHVRWRLRAFYNPGVRYGPFRADSGLAFPAERSCMETVCQEVRYGLRMLRKYPAFSLTVIITLCLGIGLNSAIFSMVSGILLRDPPVKDPEHIVVITLENPEQGSDRNPLSAPEFSALRERSEERRVGKECRSRWSPY